MVNGAWDVVMVGLIAYFWVETKGRTLEEIDMVLDGMKHSDAPDLEMVFKGKEKVGPEIVAEVAEIVGEKG